MRRLRGALAAVIALQMAACATPPAEKPQPPRLSAAALGLADAGGGDVAHAAWWRAYGDEGLNDAVALALAGHPTLALAQARMARALAATVSAQAARTPQWQPTADLTVQRFSEHGPVPPSVAGATRTLANASLAMQWEIDINGRLQAELAAAVGGLAAAEQERRAARAALAAQVVQVWIDLAGAQARLRDVKAEVTLHDGALVLLRQRVAAGLDDERALRQAEAERTALLEREAAAIGQQERARRMLAALAAQPEGRFAQAQARLADAPALPPRLDAGLLGRRGDVQAARLRIEVAVQDLQAARALYLPSLNLNAIVGLSAIGLDRLIDLGSRQIGAGPALRLPLFEVPRLKALVQGREAEIEAAVAAYNERLLFAVQDSTTALAELAAARERWQARRAVRARAEASLQLQHQRAKAGLVPQLDVLRAQIVVQQQSSQVEELRAQVLREHAGLMRALGGGPEDGPEDKKP